MKTTFKKQRGILFLIMSLLLMTACQNEDATSVATDEVALDDLLAQRSAEIDLISDDIGLIVEEAYQEAEFTFPLFLPDCVTVTTQFTTGLRERTIDFGTGCELPNGNILSGVITTSHAIDADPARREISVTFDNFYRNGVLIEGTRSVERVLSNDVGNPQSTAIVNMQVTWPNGATYTREGTRTREWIEGFSSGTWDDNVFLITGNVTTTGVQGNTFAATITTALRREFPCPYIVSGTVSLSRNNATGTLDFGNGSCDNEASWTNLNGVTQTIYLN